MNLIRFKRYQFQIFSNGVLLSDDTAYNAEGNGAHSAAVQKAFAEHMHELGREENDAGDGFTMIVTKVK
jgi:hypothetical protein